MLNENEIKAKVYYDAARIIDLISANTYHGTKEEYSKEDVVNLLELLSKSINVLAEAHE